MQNWSVTAPEIAAYAAAAAAALSLLNVVLNNRSAHTSQMYQWRRGHARETMISFIATMERLEFLWHERERERVKLAATSKALEKTPPFKVDQSIPPLMMVSFLAVAVIAGRGSGKVEKELAALVKQPQVHLLNLELSASPRCVAAARRFEKILSQILLTRVLQKVPESQVALPRDYVDRLKQARAEFVEACRRDIGVDRTLFSRIRSRLSRK